MPHAELHKRKLKTNLAILALVMGFCAMIWGITMVRISAGSAERNVSAPENPVDVPAE